MPRRVSSRNEQTDRTNGTAGDTELQQKLSANGFKEVSAQYDWSAVAKRVMEIYENILSRSLSYS